MHIFTDVKKKKAICHWFTIRKHVRIQQEHDVTNKLGRLTGITETEVTITGPVVVWPMSSAHVLVGSNQWVWGCLLLFCLPLEPFTSYWVALKMRACAYPHCKFLWCLVDSSGRPALSHFLKGKQGGVNLEERGAEKRNGKNRRRGNCS